MTDNVENLILDHLRHMRSKIDTIADGMDDLKVRMSSLESAMVGVKREVNHGEETDARQQVSLDKLMKRIERIEQRPELA